MRYDKRISLICKHMDFFYVDRNTGDYVAKENAPQELVDAINGLNAEIKKDEREGVHRY